MTMPPLPPPSIEDHDYELWGQNVRGDFWSEERVRAYGAACAAQEREACAQMLDIEHECRKHIDNHAAFYARKIRARGEA